MALKKRKEVQARRIASKLSDGRLFFWKEQLKNEIEAGYIDIYYLDLKGNTSYKKLDEMMEVVYEMETIKSIITEELDRRRGFCSSVEEE